MLNLTRRKGQDIDDTTRQKTPKREIAQLICAVTADSYPPLTLQLI